MNILIINHYAGSENHGMEYRPYFLASEWIKAGHTVTVLGASFSHLRSEQPVCNRDVTIENIQGIKYIWLRTPEYHGNGLKRIINMLTFSMQAFMKEVPIEKPDIVIDSSTYPLTIFGSHKISQKYQAKLVFEVHDLWPLSPMELGGYPKWHPFILIMQAAENFAYKHAHRVVSLLPKARDHMILHGMAPEKFFYIPNGINVTAWNSKREMPEEHRTLMEYLHSERKFVVGYSGAHGNANALKYFLKAAEILSVDGNIHFVLVGQGPEKTMLIEMSEAKGLKNVSFLPTVPKAAIPNLLDTFDACYIGWQRQPLYRFGVSPNKLMDYMMAAKPVIHAIEAGNDLVAESGCGISVHPEDPHAVVEAIFNIKKMSKQERKEMGQKGKEFILSNHGYVMLAQRFLEGL